MCKRDSADLKTKQQQQQTKNKTASTGCVRETPQTKKKPVRDVYEKHPR